MTNSKLVLLLRKLDRNQLLRFKTYLQSPYCNTDSDLDQFYRILLKYKPDFPETPLKREKISKKLERLGLLEHKTIDHLLSGTLQKLEQFLLAEFYKDHPLDRSLRLMQIYDQFQLPKLYHKPLREAQQELENVKPKDADYLLQQYLLARQEERFNQEPLRKYRPELQAAAHALDQFFLAEKSRLVLEMETAQRIIQSKYQHGISQDLFMQALSENQHKNPILQIYTAALTLLQNLDDEETYQRLKSLLEIYPHVFQPSELTDHYRNLINFCIRRISYQKDKSYYQQYLELSEKLMDLGLFLERDQIGYAAYTNLVMAGIWKGDLEWTRQFIETYAHYLPEEARETAYLYNMGQYHYALGELDQAQILFNQVDFPDSLFEMATKNYLVKVYFENEEIDLFPRHLHNYSRLLQTKELPAPLKAGIKKFLTFTQNLYNIPPFDNANLRLLQQQIEQENTLIEKDWLLNQLARRLEKR